MARRKFELVASAKFGVNLANLGSCYDVNFDLIATDLAVLIYKQNGLFFDLLRQFCRIKVEI